MKKCPYCAEEIQDEAIKCKHCGEWLEKDVQVSPQLVERQKVDPLKPQPRDTVVIEPVEEINEIITNLKQCPTCGNSNIYQPHSEYNSYWCPHCNKYIEEQNYKTNKQIAKEKQCPSCGNRDAYKPQIEYNYYWCPHCNKYIEDDIKSQDREGNVANKYINNAAIAGVISGGLTLLFSTLGTIPMWSGVIESLLAFLLSYGIYKKSRFSAIILFGLFLIEKIGQIADNELKLSGFIIGIIFLYYFFQGIRGTFAYHKLFKEEQRIGRGLTE